MLKVYAVARFDCAGISCGAVCVYPNRVADCAKYLKSLGATNIPIASGLVVVIDWLMNTSLF